MWKHVQEENCEKENINLKKMKRNTNASKQQKKKKMCATNYIKKEYIQPSCMLKI